MWLTCVLAISLVLLFVLLISRYDQHIDTTEGFNDSSGQFSMTCGGKTFNQCLKSFNCGFVVDKWGNSGCVGGDVHGPFNFEEGNYYYYHNDPYAYAMQQNENYRCNMGPRSSNRIIGV